MLLLNAAKLPVWTLDYRLHVAVGGRLAECGRIWAMDDIDPRFRGIYQLLGPRHFAAISAASVCIVGLGGVGSWSVEALARSGVGSLTLVDLDDVCVTNINRQIHALTDTVGQSKAELLAARVLAINPNCNVQVVRKFFSGLTADEILAPGFDVVLDTIDRNENKTILIGECVKRSLRVITVGRNRKTNRFSVSS